MYWTNGNGTGRRSLLSEGVRERREERFARRRQSHFGDAPAAPWASGRSPYAPLGARLPSVPRRSGVSYGGGVSRGGW